MYKDKPLKISLKDFKKIHKAPLIKRIAKKLFGIPTPTGLPMIGFLSEEQEKEGVYTWDDWKRESKEKYPVKYFLSNSVPNWISIKITRHIDDAIYWLKSHTYKRYHLLDLRQPKSSIDSPDHYRWGWIDYDKKILYACFNSLMEYYTTIEESQINYSVIEYIKMYSSNLKEAEENVKKLSNETELTDEQKEELKNLNKSIESYKKLHQDYSEIQAIYEYWTIHRKEGIKNADKLLSDWDANRANDKFGARWVAMGEHDEKFNEEETDMLIKLIKLRGYMWN